MERGFWLEMMDKYYHKLLLPLRAAAGVIYESVYGHRHAVAIACSSAVQHRLQLAVAEGQKALPCSLHGWVETGLRLLNPERPNLGSSLRITPSPPATTVISWPLMGSQGLKNPNHKAAAIFKGSELQGCSFINQVDLLATSSQSEFLGKKAFCRELMFGGLVYGSKSIHLNALQNSNRKEKSLQTGHAY